jgi:hypothetical protein
MSFTLSQTLMSSAEIGLSALSAVLDKAAAFAAAKKIDESVLLNYRLAPDMFALTRQVQIAWSSIDGAGEREITFPLGPTNKGHMKGVDFLNHFVLPNFYFHLTAAYALLRHCGVEIGKRDFLGTIPLRLS